MLAESSAIKDGKRNSKNKNWEDKELWTKFICTLGPVSGNQQSIESLVRAGVDILRNNFAHCEYEEYRERKRLLDEINARLGTKVKMQADLQGPNIRVGILPPEGMKIEAEKEYVCYTVGGEKSADSDIFINDDTLHMDVKPGEPITFMDGALEGEILWVDGYRMGVKMINGGLLKSRKSVNVPETKLSSPVITEKDRLDLDFLMETGIDYIALSFICSRQEIDEIREIIGDRPIQIISKIERKAAIINLPEIIEASDAVMIARGDLGIELPLEEIPILQKMIISMCEHYNKPVITATQMLLSMAKSHRPTRAEVSDVANAVFDRSDALMLSEETAEGVDPVNALKVMRRIAGRVEDYLYHRPNFFE